MSKWRVVYVDLLPGAHQLKLPYRSKCNAIHGHTYRIELHIAASELENDMVIDFYKLKGLLEKFDHVHWNAFVPHPTSERIAEYLFDFVSEMFRRLGWSRLTLEKVVVFEGKENGASYSNS